MATLRSLLPRRDDPAGSAVQPRPPRPLGGAASVDAALNLTVGGHMASPAFAEDVLLALATMTSPPPSRAAGTVLAAALLDVVRGPTVDERGLLDHLLDLRVAMTGPGPRC